MDGSAWRGFAGHDALDGAPEAPQPQPLVEIGRVVEIGGGHGADRARRPQHRSACTRPPIRQRGARRPGRRQIKMRVGPSVADRQRPLAQARLPAATGIVAEIDFLGEGRGALTGSSRISAAA